jgi:hypothetical protein
MSFLKPRQIVEIASCSPFFEPTEAAWPQKSAPESAFKPDGIAYGAGAMGLLSGHASLDAEKAGQIFG